jgi:hypothetical protein
MKKENNETKSIKEVRNWKAKVAQETKALHGKELIEYFNKGIRFKKTKKAA